MNLPQLRYFVTLAHVEHYTRAAELLNVTQPCITHTVQVLEDELGVRLFEKSGRNVVLTGYGRVFLQDVENMLNQLDNSVSRLQMYGKGSGEINIGFLRTLGLKFIPWLMDRYLKQNQDKDIVLHPFCDRPLSIELIDGLKERVYDVVFCSKVEGEPMVDFVPVFHEELAIILPPDHPLAEKEDVTLEDTLAYQHIAFKEKSGIYPTIRQLFLQETGRMPDVAYELEEDQVIAGFVAAGFGIAVVPNMPILKSMKLKVIPLKTSGCERNFYMASLKDVYQPPVLTSFIRFVRKNAGSYFKEYRK